MKQKFPRHETKVSQVENKNSLGDFITVGYYKYTTKKG